MINRFLNNFNEEFSNFYELNFDKNEVTIFWESKNFDFQNIDTKDKKAIIFVRHNIQNSARTSLGDTYNRRYIITNMFALFSKQVLGDSYHFILTEKLGDFLSIHKSPFGYQSSDSSFLGPDHLSGSESHLQTTVSQDYTLNIRKVLT